MKQFLNIFFLLCVISGLTYITIASKLYLIGNTEISPKSYTVMQHKTIKHPSLSILYDIANHDGKITKKEMDTFNNKFNELEKQKQK